MPAPDLTALPMTEAIRLSKRLIELVGCSRREAELYIEGGWVSVVPAEESGKLGATGNNDSNQLEIRVFGNEAHRQAVVIARLDNLGKGASGAAVQNLKLMLGL